MKEALTTMHPYEAVLRHLYYPAMDAGNFDTALSIFSEDIHYTRGAQEDIHGKDELWDFMSNRRKIAEGKHTDLSFRIYGRIVLVAGRFEGMLKNGEAADNRFIDIHLFSPDAKVYRRITTFPNGEREI